MLNEKWADKEERLRVSSPYGHLSGWKLVSFIVKSGADMKQELLAMQIVEELKKTFMEERVPVWIKRSVVDISNSDRYLRSSSSFGIMVISNRAGLVETIRNSISVDSIKKHGYRNKFCKDGIPYTLYDYFVKVWPCLHLSYRPITNNSVCQRFGPYGSPGFLRAQDAFMRSLAAYSLMCYLFQVKDRYFLCSQGTTFF